MRHVCQRAAPAASFSRLNRTTAHVLSRLILRGREWVAASDWSSSTLFVKLTSKPTGRLHSPGLDSESLRVYWRFGVAAFDKTRAAASG